MTNIYVGNLSFGTTEDAIRNAFAQYGQISTVKIIASPNTGKGRDFAIVEMKNDSEARTAIDALDGTDLDGSTIYVPPRRSLKRCITPYRDETPLPARQSTS